MRAAAGHRWVWVPESSLAWEVLPASAAPRACQRTAPDCGAPAVVRHRRADGPHHFCADHLYSRRLHDGVLEVRVLRRITTEET